MAGRICTVCSHEERGEIDNLLVRRTSYRNIARHYGVSKDALSRHAKVHLPEELQRAEQKRRDDEADGLLRDLRSIHIRMLRIMVRADEQGQWSVALRAGAEARRNIELDHRMREVAELEERLERLERQERLQDERPHTTPR